MKLKILLTLVLLFLSINIFATGISYEGNRTDAVNDLKTPTVESAVLILEEGSSDSIPTIKQYWLNPEDNSIREEINFTININDIGEGSNSIYYKWAKDSNDNTILQTGTSSDYSFKINYTNYTNTKQEVKTDNTTISDKFFYNSSAGTILNSATGTKISGIFANNHNSQTDQFYNGGNIINYRYKINSIDGVFINNYETGATWALGGAIFNTENSVGIIRSYIDDITGDFIGNYTNSSSINSNDRSCGGAIVNYTTIENINSNFILNHSNGVDGIVEGGAIANLDIDTKNMAYITNIKGDFLLNYIYATGYLSGGNGGAIVNNGYITNIEGNFIGNSIKSVQYTGAGGAIYNEYNIQNITGDFIENYIDAYSTAVGGAIYNKGLLTGATSINNITGNFIGNYASSTNGNARGGAIYNNYKITEIKGIFENNISYSAISEADGGSIYNRYIIETIEGNFINNSAIGTTEAKGGAIYNIGVIRTIESNFIKNSVFANNNGYGGAIYNSGVTVSIVPIIGKITGNFINNTASHKGGAIYNDGGTINLITDENNIEFTGNTANGVSNAIHDDNGTINLWADENKSIVFNDRITSNDNRSILNINSSTTTLNAIGKVILNEDMSGYTGTVNLYGGEIELQSKIEENLNINKFFSGNINLSSGTLNILNNAIDNITVSNLTTTSNVNLQIDADLSNNTSDNFTVTNNVIGEINLEAINILNINNDSGYIILFNNEVSPDINILTNGFYDGYEYVFTNSLNHGVIYYEKTGIERTFKEVINLEKYVRSYSLSNNENVTENLENLGGHQLTIFGNGYDIISSDNYEGIYVGEDKVLNIENVNNWSGFNNTYGAIKNEGTLNVSGTNFAGNQEQDIINNGNLTLSGVSSSFEKGIVGIGTTTINGVNINLGNAIIEQKKIEINNNGNLITKAQNVIGAIENNSNLILTEGTNNNYIYGNGETTIDGEVINSSTIVNSVTINANKQLTTKVNGITGDIENNGSLVFNNNGTNNNWIKGAGTTTIDGEVINSSTIVNNVTINKNRQLTTSATNIIGLIELEEEGRLIFHEGNNNNIITGEGIIVIDGIVSNNKYISNNNLQVGSNKNLINNSTITINESLLLKDNSKIINNCALLINNGINNGNIEQTANISTTTIYGNFINNGRIEQNIFNVEEDGKVTNNSVISATKITNNGNIETSATNIIGNIVNNGILLFNAGNINNNQITGSGTLNITVDNFINNSTISADNLNLESVNFKLTENGNLFIKNLSATNSEIDFANSILQEHNFKTISLTDNLNLSVDADLQNKTMDTISANSFSGNGKINVKTINILSDAKENKTEISFTTSTVLKNKITGVTNASSKLFKYDVNYDKNTGNFNFLLTQNSNPIIAESQVARASGLITQTTVLTQAFSSIDNIRNRIIQAKQKGLLYASAADLIFDSPNRIESGLWIRPFMTQDTVNLDNLSIDNSLTGTLAGIDLAVGENSLVSVYLGYAGSNQKYEDIKINQSGYILGATGMIIKEKWYAGLTANINFNKADSQSIYGTDSFDMNMYSIGAKAGYNFDLSEKFILEPNLTLMYGNVNSNEYETKQGAKIDAQNTTNIIAEPQVKAKLDLTNGWQPYGLLGYVINAGEKSKIVVDNIAFDEMGISGYTEYGLGVNKTFKNSAWSCYLQLTGRSGDITGFDGNIGIKYSFLNKEEKEDIELIKYLKKKEKDKIKEEQTKQKELEEEQKRIEKEEKERLEAEEKARIEEEKRLREEEEERQKALEEERLRLEQEEQEKQRQLEIERKLNEYYN